MHACTQLRAHKSGGWCDTYRMLEWCKVRRECLSCFQVQMLKDRAWQNLEVCFQGHTVYLSGTSSRKRWVSPYNETTKCMISNRDVVFHGNIFKVSNKHITIAISSYVGSDTIFMDNSTST
jgi:hypothetical protein